MSEVNTTNPFDSANTEPTLTYLEAVDRMGDPTHSFRPSWANHIAGMILVALILGGGFFLAGWVLREIIQAKGDLPFYDKKAMSWVTVGLATLLLGLLIMMGAGLAWFLYKNASLRVHVCPRGIFCQDSDGIELFEWERIVAVTEIVIREHPPILKPPLNRLLPRVTNYAYAIHVPDGREETFSANNIRKIRSFGKLLKEATERHQITWSQTEQ